MKLLFKDDLILELCSGKKVLHIGATDSPYHKDRGRKNSLLHQRLQMVCKNLVGIDIDKAAIAYLKRNFGINNIFYGDVCKNIYELDLSKHKFDYIVFADVIEHLENPGIALENLKNLMSGGTKLIVTTPNVFSYQNLKTYLSGRELVHPDHVYWPSYKTMRNLFETKKFKINYFTYCFWGKCEIKTFKGRMLYRLVTRFKQHIMPCMFFVVRS